MDGVAGPRLTPKKCNGCGLCEAVCPRAVLAVEGGKVRLRDRDACVECGACGRNCPTAAVSVKVRVGSAAGLLRSWHAGSEPSGRRRAAGEEDRE